MKNGKLPFDKKTDYISPSEAFGGGELTLEPAIDAYMKKNGFGYKWLSIKHLKTNGGRHRSGWNVFIVPEELQSARKTNLFGNAPDGTIVVGDLVLGFKPLTGRGVTVESHRKVLAERVKNKTAAAMGTGKGAINVEDDDNG